MNYWRRLGAAGVVIALFVPGTGASAGATLPGRLPQTNKEPSFTRTLKVEMHQLWRSITNDSLSIGSTVFFPQGAYETMKAGEIANPSSDYHDRLVAFFKLDLAAYRHLTGSRAHSTLLRVESSRADASWIAPGSCENRVGYWHLPGVRLVFRHRGVVESVAVASLISWRGVWYVVHLGPNPSPYDVGTVDDFQRGPGRPGPPGGC